LLINSCIPFTENFTNFENQLQFLYRIGYQGAFIEISTEKMLKSFMTHYFPQPIAQIHKEIKVQDLLSFKPSNSPIFLIPRITISSKNPELLKQELSQWADKAILIAVVSLNKDVLEVAARDGRVDLLSLPTIDHWKCITKGIISLTKQNHCTLDISLTQILEEKHFTRTRILRELYKLFLMAHPGTHLFTLGAYTDDVWLYRGPNESIAILKALLEVAEPHAAAMVSQNAEKLALRYIKRFHGLFLEPDVEIIQINSPTELFQELQDDLNLNKLNPAGYIPKKTKKSVDFKEKERLS
jgi:RNase P/RNase MRP subunit p30